MTCLILFQSYDEFFCFNKLYLYNFARPIQHDVFASKHKPGNILPLTVLPFPFLQVLFWKPCPILSRSNSSLS